MAILPDDIVDPELADLIGGSSMAEVAKLLRPTPEFVIDADPLAELPFGTEDPPTEIPFEKAQTDINIREKNSTVTMEKNLVGILPVVEASRHQPYIKGVIDSVRHRPAFRKIKNSEIWTDLVQSCVNYVEGQLAEAQI
jgi:hypothetical protein